MQEFWPGDDLIARPLHIEATDRGRGGAVLVEERREVAIDANHGPLVGNRVQKTAVEMSIQHENFSSRESSQPKLHQFLSRELKELHAISGVVEVTPPKGLRPAGPKFEMEGRLPGMRDGVFRAAEGQTDAAMFFVKDLELLQEQLPRHRGLELRLESLRRQPVLDKSDGGRGIRVRLDEEEGPVRG